MACAERTQAGVPAALQAQSSNRWKPLKSRMVSSLKKCVWLVAAALLLYFRYSIAFKSSKPVPSLSETTRT
jgi:hypothetical protein